MNSVPPSPATRRSRRPEERSSPTVVPDESEGDRPAEAIRLNRQARQTNPGPRRPAADGDEVATDPAPYAQIPAEVDSRLENGRPSTSRAQPGEPYHIPANRGIEVPVCGREAILTHRGLVVGLAIVAVCLDPVVIAAG